MATPSLKFTGVTVSFDDMSSSTTQLSQITLTTSEVQFSDDQSQIQTTIPLTDIQAIQVNQPIFGANFIVIEYTNNEGQHFNAKVTFNKGGATQFSQAFFRRTEGRVETESSSSQSTNVDSSTQAKDKKNK